MRSRGRPRQYEGATTFALLRKQEECGGTVDLEQRRWHPPRGCDQSMADSALGKLRMKGFISTRQYEAGCDLRTDYMIAFGRGGDGSGNGELLICPPHVTRMLRDLRRGLGSDYGALYNVCCHDMVPNWVYGAVGGKKGLLRGLDFLIRLTQYNYRDSL